MVLDDHVKKGKKLMPPMMVSGTPIELGNWPLDRVPELFWLAFMVERLGGRESLNVVSRMSKAIHSTVNKSRSKFKVIRAYFHSEHLKFSESERKAIVGASRRSKWFQTLSPLLADMQVIWPELPSGYLTTKESTIDKSQLTEEIKGVLNRFSHRHDDLSAVVQAIVALAEIRSGHVTIAQGLEWPNYQAIVDDPTSAEAKGVIGFAVATCGQLNLFGRQTSDLQWNRSFWNRCYRLQPCEYDYE